MLAAIPVVLALVGSRLLITLQLARWTRLAATRFGVDLVSIMKR